MDTIRIYSKRLRTWCGYDGQLEQVELAYKDYDLDGNVIGAGSEDFSHRRLVEQTELRAMCVWTGDRRSDGSRWFDIIGLIRFRSGAKLADVKRVLKATRFPDAIEIQLRK